LLTLADELEQGSLQRDQLMRKLGALAEAADNARASIRGALGEIHDILDPDQRASFADSLKQLIGQEPRLGEGSSSNPRAGLDRPAQDLGLDSQQRQRVREALETLKPETSGARDSEGAAAAAASALDRALDAFKGERFSIDQFAPRRDPRARSQAMI